METEGREEELLRSVAIENARSIRRDRDRAQQELAQTQEALRESEAWVRLALTSADMGTWRVNLETGMGMRDANLNRILGLDAVSSTHPIEDRFRLIHHEDKPAAIAAWQSAIKDRTSYESEFRVVRDDGTTRWLREQGRPIVGEDGLPDFITGVTLDITARKQAEQARATLAAIVDSSDDAIISKDLNGVITSWNGGAERLFGYTALEAIGRSVSMLIPDDRIDEEPAILKRLRKGKRVEHYETIRRRKDGTLIDISLSVSPVSDERGRVVGASKIARDISERKQSEAKLKTMVTREQEARTSAEVANRVKDEFLAMVSHELRTPLNAIVGWTLLLKSGKLDQPEIERAIQIIDRNAKAQAMIIDELLDVSRIISGKLKIEMKAVDLPNVIEAAIDGVRLSADAKAIEIIHSLDSQPGPVAGDAVRLQQVIWNLLTNAIKFTPKGGRVVVELKRSATDVKIIVTDNGDGISPEFLPKVFERFQQGDGSSKRMHGGLGLGLSIVRTLIRMHGGSVQGESEGKGRGATFTVSLPLMEGTPADGLDVDFESLMPRIEHASEDGDGMAPGNLKTNVLSGLRVLAVDDQLDTRELITLTLTRHGAEVRACKSVAETLRMIQDWKPEIIVSDIGMPGEDGYDLIRKIRALKLEDGGRIPAIALTGYAGADDESKARAAGYQVQLTKPIDLRVLTSTIAELAGRL
jgi:PAS domain S-box-containing protein